jgi:hypothetical protein
MCETLLETDYEKFVIFEYDTVNLADTLPPTDHGKIASGIMETSGPDIPGGYFFISLPPWIMCRPLMELLVKAMHSTIHHKQPEDAWISGLLDRWLAVLFIKHEIPIENIVESMPFPFPHLAPLQMIAQSRSLVHGYKHKEDFKNLWPE